ncbi:MAG: hypothetical protein JO031_14460 [Ktedonobacteraceae bacterium]|nr:hypothetical protein [Ktedonobacteraceae bacterium]
MFVLAVNGYYCYLACFAGQFVFIVAVFAGAACKNSNNKYLVSADGAKSVEKWKALPQFKKI